MISKIIPLIFLLYFNFIFSQENEIGLFAGGSNYIGDVGPTTYVNPFSYNSSANFVFGIIYKRNFNERISARISYDTQTKNLKQAKDAEDILIKSYETGTIDFNDVLDIQELQLKFQMNLI